MKADLAFGLALHAAHARMQLKLDDALGLYHGISFNDFALLSLLAQADGGRLGIAALARSLSQAPSAVLRQLIVLEKIGLVLREGGNGLREAVLVAAGRALVHAACETAGGICGEAVEGIAPAAREVVCAAMLNIARERACSGN
jgi:DNA-binding IclR family transcriptional regulator